MHILLIHQAFAALNEPGGTRHHELARFLVSRGHRVTVIASPVSYLTGSTSQVTPQAGSEAVFEPGITILRPYAYPAWHRSFVHRVFSFLSFMISSFFAGLQVKNVDLVWGTSPPIFQAGAAWALARVKRKPFVFEVRDLWPAFAVGVGVLHSRLLIRAAEAFERFLYRHADQMIVNSPGFIDHIRQRGAQKISLVPNGADTEMFEPDADGLDFREEHHLDQRYVVMYAGAHGLSNDLEVLLEAARQIQEYPEITVVFLGDGKEKPNLIRKADELNLSNVRFLPPVPKTRMPDALAAADVCVAILKPIPEYKTVYPNKVFDYMAAGRPVILAIEGVIQGVVEQADAGICIPPGDPLALASAIVQLAANPEIGRDMGKRGRQHVVEHFDRQAVAQQLETVFINTLQNS
jgi:glycosyltransferase involved in cell wall biosynthesis